MIICWSIRRNFREVLEYNSEQVIRHIVCHMKRYGGLSISCYDSSFCISLTPFSCEVMMVFKIGTSSGQMQ